MTRGFMYTPKFDKEWEKLGLTDEDLRLFEVYLLENPEAGNIIEGTGGIRKVRWAFPNTGKSGGIRVLYVDFIFYDLIIIFDLFTKDEKENLTQAEKKALKQVVKAMGEELKK